MHEILTVEEMAEADRRAVALGVPSLTLMENAGWAVANAAEQMVSRSVNVAILCGPGNNGGDGFVAARQLKRRGYTVHVFLLGSRDALKGDAAEMARRWGLPIWPASADALLDVDLVIDAMFGAGLTRRLDGVPAELAEAINASSVAVLSVDVPSGLNGTTGTAAGPVVRATRTATFFRKKPGHLLMPGRALCGEVVVADIGIPDDVLVRPLSPSVSWTERGEGWGEGRPLAPESGAAPHPSPLPMQEQSMGRGDMRASHTTHENHPSLWLPHVPFPRLDAHKYARGHALVVSGPAFQTGAARLAARGALRMGAGLVTVASPPSALLENAAHLTAIMIKPFGDARDLAENLEDKRKNAVLIGPGSGVGADARGLVEAVLASGAAAVLDADALTSYALSQGEAEARAGFGFTAVAARHHSGPASLFTAIVAQPARPVVMTPHEGEFARLFHNVAPIGASKLERARAAATLSGAIVVLKGPDTVIASPDGRAAINSNAPPWLATAGSGDVLAGFITGLLAQGMPAFDAACAAVWLHGECANKFGIGLIAEDLPDHLPEILDNLHHAAGRTHRDPEKPNGGVC